MTSIRGGRAPICADSGASGLKLERTPSAKRPAMQTTTPAPLLQLRLVANRMTDWQFHCWYWGDAIAIDRLLEADELCAGAYRDQTIETLQRWHRHCSPNFDDVLAPGAAIIRLAIDGDLPAEAVARVLGPLDALPRAHGAVPALEPHRQPFRFGMCIDALYHVP